MPLPPFEVVLDEHGPAVLRLCRALLGPHDADDAWSETFLAALGAYPRLRADSDVRAWLVTIAHHKVVDLVRRRDRAPVPTGGVADGPGGDPIPDDPDTELWAALAALPDKRRRAVAYHHVAGLPHARVAELLGGSEAAARRAAADGIAQLRATYTPRRTP